LSENRAPNLYVLNKIWGTLDSLDLDSGYSDVKIGFSLGNKLIKYNKNDIFLNHVLIDYL
jgi:hypothetical protein